MTAVIDSCYVDPCENPRTADIRRNVESRQEKFPRLVESKNIGQRLVIAFRERYGTEDRKFIAEKLGYKTDKAIYKVISGERELGFAQLLMFRDSTNRSIDWLLTGEDDVPAKPQINPETFKENHRTFIELLALDRGISFDDVVRELVGVGLDERACELSRSYRNMRPEEVEEVVNAYLANASKDNSREETKKRR